jgi:hypothetical protein
MRGILIRAAVCLVVLALAFGCIQIRNRAETEQTERPVHIVKLSGVECCNNLSVDLGYFVVKGGEDRPASLLLRDGDRVVISVESSDGNKFEFVVPYRSTDGLNLQFSVKSGCLYLAGEPVTLDLDSSPESWQWLENVTDEDLSSLRILSLDDTPVEVSAEKALALVTRIAAVNPHIGLSITDSDDIGQALALLDPAFLEITDRTPLTPEQISILSSETSISDLSFNPRDPASLDLVSQLPNLRSLDLGRWDPVETGPLPDLPNLEALRLVLSSLADLAQIAGASRVRELSLRLNENEEGLSLEEISGFPNLTVFNSTLCGGRNFPDTSATRITWLGLPPDTTQEDFGRIVRSLPGLRVLEIVNAKSVTDISPIKDLKGLEALYWLPDSDAVASSGLATLSEMKSLRYILLPEGIFTNQPEAVTALQQSLPDTVIVPGKVCLGSGWLLLTLPAILLGRFIIRSRHGERHARIQSQ